MKLRPSNGEKLLDKKIPDWFVYAAPLAAGILIAWASGRWLYGLLGIVLTWFGLLAWVYLGERRGGSSHAKSELDASAAAILVFWIGIALPVGLVYAITDSKDSVVVALYISFVPSFLAGAVAWGIVEHRYDAKRRRRAHYAHLPPDERDALPPISEGMKVCPDCIEEVVVTASECPHCGYAFDR